MDFENELKIKYPLTAALMESNDPFSQYSEEISYFILSTFLQGYGLTLSLIPMPIKRKIIWSAVILYSFDSYTAHYQINGDWTEKDYTECYGYDILNLLDYTDLEEAKRAGMVKALELFESQIIDFKYYAA